MAKPLRTDIGVRTPAHGEPPAHGDEDAHDEELDSLRPKVRGDCFRVPRPCPFVSCRHHLYLELRTSGSMLLPFPELEPDELPESCSLDLAERDGMTLLEVGNLLGVSRERIRQIERKALHKLGVVMRLRRMDPNDFRKGEVLEDGSEVAELGPSELEDTMREPIGGFEPWPG